MRTTIVLTVVGLATGIAVAVASVSAVAASPPRQSAGMTPHVESLSLTISGSHMQQRVSPSSGNIAVAPGVTVRMTITNYTHEYHTFTIPGLHVSALIFPAHGATPRKTTFTFTANQMGTFAWHCAFCQGGFHGHQHPMGGDVFAIIDPSVMP
jgi:heme/copper-type cytochrome/quinol oxidase subunit 2